jgi:hypothetical protein
MNPLSSLDIAKAFYCPSPSILCTIAKLENQEPIAPMKLAAQSVSQSVEARKVDLF